MRQFQALILFFIEIIETHSQIWYHNKREVCMDINKMRLVKISPHASAKVMFDHFSTIENEQMFLDAEADSPAVAVHAGALCLYAATLLTKVHENEPQNIACDCSEREKGLRDAIKAHPRFSHLSEEEVSTMAHNMILKDIRNSFAHGNFEISCDIYTKKLYYVLQPRRKDFVVDKPIIISKDALFAANRQYVGKLAGRYMFLDREQLEYKAKHEFGNELKSFVLPVDMLRLAENYLDNKQKHYQRYKPKTSRYLAIYYPLLVSQMTYEQDDYYHMFNKNSNIFDKIAHIRNAISHDGFEFDNQTFDITHTDRAEVSTDPLEKSVRMLKLVRDHKNLLIFTENFGFSEEAQQHLTEGIKAFFDSLFVHGGYEEEEREARETKTEKTK